MSWWGAWQLPWVQNSAARWLSSVFQQKGVELEVQSLKMNWRGHWELCDVQGSIGGHSLSASRIELGVTPWGLSRWMRGHGSISHLEVSNLSVDGTPLEMLNDISLSGWVVPCGQGWEGEIKGRSGWTASGLLRQDDSGHWDGDINLEWNHSSLFERLWFRRGQPAVGHIHVESSESGWTAQGEGQLPMWAVGPGDEVESSLRFTAGGNDAGWKGDVTADGLWDHEGLMSEASLKVAVSGDARGLRIDTASCSLPFATIQGSCEFGDRWVGSWSLETEELANLARLYRGVLGKELADLKGQVHAALDWHGTFADCSVGLSASCTQGKGYGLQADKLKVKARSVLHAGDWRQLLWNSQGSCTATHLVALGTKVEQLRLDWQPDEVGRCSGTTTTSLRGLKGSISGGGLWGGRLQICSDWSLGSDCVVIDNLAGNLFGQPICSVRPLRLEALGPSWLQSSGLRLCDVEMHWGQGRVSGSSEWNSRQWKGCFQAQHAPLEWVGMLLGPLKCSGFGDLRLTLGGDGLNPRWHAELSSSEASVVLGPLTGNCRPLLTLDGSGQHLDVQGRIGIAEARLGLNHLEVSQLPAFEVQWAGQGLQERAGRPFNVTYDIDLETDSGALCSVGPVQTRWEGALQLRGNNDQPILRGSLHLQPGEVELVGFPLALTGGSIHISGTQPEQIVLDIQANTPLQQGRALISCTGCASQPCLSITSDSNLSTVEMLQQLAAQAQSRGGLETARRIEQAVQWLPKADPEAIQRLRKETGLDRMEFAAADPNHEALQLMLGQQLAERVLVQLHQQMGADISGFSIESGESFSTVQGRSYALQAGTGLLPPGRLALRWNMHY